MTVDDRLAHEARARPRQAVVAAVAAALLRASNTVQLAGPQAKVSELTVQLITLAKRFPLDVVGAVLQAAGLLALVLTLSFLFGATRARKPELAPWARIAVLAGGALTCLGGIVYAAVLAVKAHQFLHHGAQTYEQAQHLTSGAALQVLQSVVLVAPLVLQAGVVFIALNAMRVGLLTRAVGQIGIIAGGAGFVQALVPILGFLSAALEIFWLGALAYLLSGRSPSGELPAWRTGRAEPWPSPQELREQRARAAAGASSKPAAGRQPAPPREPVGARSAGGARSASAKRKRKRRR